MLGDGGWSVFCPHSGSGSGNNSNAESSGESGGGDVAKLHPSLGVGTLVSLSMVRKNTGLTEAERSRLGFERLGMTTLALRL